MMNKPKFAQSLIGQDRDVVRGRLMEYVNGAQEDGSTIKFQKNGLIWTVFFEGEVCKNIHIQIAPVMKSDELKLYNENIDGF
jgi:hypothetical protein